MYAQKNHLDNKESSNGAPGTNVHNSSNVTTVRVPTVWIQIRTDYQRS